jgi:hypothetical protein
MTYHRLDFKTPSVHPGLNQTIRSGEKWLKARPGDRLDICETGADISTSEVSALVIACQQVTVRELLDGGLLRFSHVPGARDFSGLDRAMRSAYGNDYQLKPVVILWFWVE